MTPCDTLNHLLIAERRPQSVENKMGDEKYLALSTTSKSGRFEALCEPGRSCR